MCAPSLHSWILSFLLFNLIFLFRYIILFPFAFPYLCSFSPFVYSFIHSFFSSHSQWKKCVHEYVCSKTLVLLFEWCAFLDVFFGTNFQINLIWYKHWWIFYTPKPLYLVVFAYHHCYRFTLNQFHVNGNDAKRDKTLNRTYDENKKNCFQTHERT